MRVGVWVIAAAWYPIRCGIASKTLWRNTLARALRLRNLSGQKNSQEQGKRTMSGRLETWRLQAYNTAKQSENKMHDDTVAKRFGFSGGLVNLPDGDTWNNGFKFLGAGH